MTERRRRHFLVAGRVQGVGFRYFTRATACELGLGGFVRNRPDGLVEIEVEGEVVAMGEFEKAVRKGPPGARVETFTTEPRPLAASSPREFTIAV